MRLQLSLRARSLSPPAEHGSNPDTSLDPFAVVTQLHLNGLPKKLGQTEVIPMTTSPDWTAIFFIDDFELGQAVLVAISVFSDKTILGSCIVDVNKILGASGSSLAYTFKADSDAAIIVHVRPATDSGVFNFQLKGIRLPNIEHTKVPWFNKSDPFFELQRSVGDGTDDWDTIYRSTHLKNNLNPKWPAGSVEVSALCSGDYDEPLRLVVYDHNSSREHEVMGTVMVTLKQLLGSVVLKKDNLKDPLVASKALTLSRDGKDMGRIVVRAAEITGLPEAAAESTRDVAADQVSQTLLSSEPPTPTFVHYVVGGCDLRVLIAIDFTASNGDPKEATSLHHLSTATADADAELNAYETSMLSICPLLSGYDSDQKYPLWGFGANPNKSSDDNGDDDLENNCFQIGPDPEVDQVEGILKAYREFLASDIKMKSQRDFSEVIKKAAKQVKEPSQESQCYTILLILSDGDPDDISKTMEALKETQDAPLSVVIIGVGDGSFSAIQEMERDLETSATLRDMFSFAQFSSLDKDPIKLREAALGKIPNQLVSYFKSHEIYPLPPPPLGAKVAVEPYNEATDASVPIEINNQGQARLIGDLSPTTKKALFTMGMMMVLKALVMGGIVLAKIMLT